MRDSILLIIKDSTLRRLYHGLLLNQGIEVVPMSKIEDALAFQVIDSPKLIVMYPDDMEIDVVRSYLNLQKSFVHFACTSTILLSCQGEDYARKNTKRIYSVDISKLNPHEVISQIVVIFDQEVIT